MLTQQICPAAAYMQPDNAGDSTLEKWALMQSQTADAVQEKVQLMRETCAVNYRSFVQAMDAMPMVLSPIEQNMKRGVPHQIELACPPAVAGA